MNYEALLNEVRRTVGAENAALRDRLRETNGLLDAVAHLAIGNEEINNLLAHRRATP